MLWPGLPGNDGSMLTVDLKAELDLNGVAYDAIEHRRTLTAAAEAEAVGVPARRVAKTVVLVGEAGFVRAAVPASEKLDMHRVRDALGDNGSDVRLATEAELAAGYPMFELGAVPPFGGPAGDRVVLDRGLAEQESVVLEIGNHEESVRLATFDLLALTGARVADLIETKGKRT